MNFRCDAGHIFSNTTCTNACALIGPTSRGNATKCQAALCYRAGVTPQFGARAPLRPSAHPEQLWGPQGPTNICCCAKCHDLALLHLGKLREGHWVNWKWTATYFQTTQVMGDNLISHRPPNVTPTSTCMQLCVMPYFDIS